MGAPKRVTKCTSCHGNGFTMVAVVKVAGGKFMTMQKEKCTRC